MSEFEIFEAAQKLTDLAARAAYVDQACAENAELRASVLALLEASGLTCEFLDAPSAIVPSKPVDPQFASTFVSPASSSPSSSSRVIAGKYKLLQQIGEGGMGTVYMAEQLAPIRRKVAVKLIKEGRDSSKSILARFSAEQQAIALMDHPNIARLFDAGTTDRNEPFFVMELINGKPIAVYCDENRLTLEERIALFIPVCHAVQHAHHKGIIHRDIKSTNILVAQYDGVPVAKVIDFGLVKAIGQQLTDHTSPSLFGTVVGTPGYMSPEQATFNQLDIDARSDIYSLAAVLYELLTGSTPHAIAELKEKAMLEVLRIIRDDEPARASHRLSSSNTLPSLAATRRIEPRRLVGFIKGELDLVVMKALERERNLRYQHPSDFADDLQRFINHEPVLAAPHSFTYQLRKYLRKRWKPLLVVAALVFTVAAGLIGVGWQEFRRLETLRGKELSDLKAEKEERKAKDEKHKRELADAKAREALAREELTKRDAAAREREADSKGYVGTMGRVSQEENQRASGWAERSWERLQHVTKLQSPLRNDADIRSAVATVLIADEYRTKPDWTFSGSKADGVKDGSVTCAAYSPSGDVLAVTLKSDYSHLQPRLLLLDATTGKVKQTLSGADNWPPQEAIQKSTINALRSRFDQCMFLDTDHVLLAGTTWGRLYRWDVSKSPPDVKFVNVGNNSVHLFVTPNSRWCVTRCWGSKQLQCWNTQTLEPAGNSVESEMPTEGVSSVDSESILVHTQSGTRLLSLPDLKVKQEIVRSTWGVFHPSGQFYATHNGHTLHAASWPDAFPLHAYENPVNEGPIRLDLAASSELRTRSGYSQTGQIFATTFANERGIEFRMWDAWGGKPRWRLPVPDGTVLKWGGQAISGDADHTAIIAKEEVTQFSRLRPTLIFCRAPGHPSGVRYVRTAPDGTAIAVLGERRKDGNDSFVVWKTGDAPQTLHSSVAERINSIPPKAIDALSYSPDGKWLATAGNSNATGIGIIVSNAINLRTKVSLKVPDEGGAIGRPSLNAGNVAGFGWSARGDLVAAIDVDLFAWNLQTNPPRLIGREVPNNLLGGVRSYASMAMNGTDVGWAVTIQSDLRKFRVGDGRIEVTNRVQVPGEGNSRICRIDPSNGRLAIGKADGSVVLFDTKKEVFGTLMTEGHANSVQAMLWLNERRLLTGSRDGWFAIWDVSADGQLSLWYRLQLNAPVSDIAPTADKQAVYVACSDETSLRVLNLSAIDSELEELFSKNSPATQSAPAFQSDPVSASPKKVAVKPGLTSIAGTAIQGVQQSALTPIANYAAEREAADWVLSLGGTVSLNDMDGTPLPLSNGKLPDANFTLNTVELVEPPRFTNEGLSKLSACRRFTSLRFAQVANLTDKGFSHLKQVRVRDLFLDGCPLLTDGVMDTVATLEGLESLSLQRIKVTDAGIAALASLKWLRTINVATSQITDAGLLELALICPMIDSMSIDWSPDGKQSVRGIARFQHLMQFIINGGQLTDDAVVVVNSIPTLNILTIRSPMNDLTIKRLSMLKALRVLRLDSTGDESVARFSATILNDIEWPQGLQALYFKGSAVSPRDEDLLYLAKSPNLKVIGVGSLKEARHLQRYTHSGLVKLRELRPDLYIEVEHVAYEPGKPLPLTAPQD
ncbi:MAG: protein kinase [Planctomycetota bacterium]